MRQHRARVRDATWLRAAERAGWDAMSLGEAVAAMRLRGALTQQALADELGVNRSYVAQLERGQTTLPGAGFLERVADALNLSMNERCALIELADSERTTVALPAVMPAEARRELLRALARARADDSWGRLTAALRALPEGRQPASAAGQCKQARPLRPLRPQKRKAAR